MRLAQPPPARIAVRASADMMLPNGANLAYERAVAAALQQHDVPAVPGEARSGDWRLALGARRGGGMVTPIFILIAPSGEEEGAEQAGPVPAESWQRARPETFRQVATDAAGRVATLLGRVEAARRQSSPASLNNRPTRTSLTEITGAPGDGNQALARLLRESLGKLGQVVQESTVGADFLITARVSERSATAKTRRIEIVWLIHNSRGEEVGRVAQQNDVPNGMLDRYWGDVAVVVTQEASVAIRDVILTQSDRR